MASTTGTRISHPTIEATLCPGCDNKTLHLETRFEARQIGEYSLAGQAMKFSAVMSYWVVCDSCGLEGKGKV